MKYILCVLLFMCGTGFLAQWLYLIYKCTVRVSATIEDIEMRGGPNERLRASFHPTFRYKVEHCWYTAKAHGEMPYWSGYPKCKAGDRVDILIDKSNPKFCIPADYADFKKCPYDLLLGVISIIGAIGLVIFK